MDKPPRTFWQIWNMSFGFLGIQFGWGLQMANMSAIYEYLGARADQIPILWLAAPLTGLIVQPIIGHASDRTWGRLGRRRPYFLGGAILSSMALILMPRSSTLWMAAGLLWVLDASINISMEPFRAFVADLLPEFQRTRGFAMQSLFIGLGAVIASAIALLADQCFSRGGDQSCRDDSFHRASFLLHWRRGLLGAVLWTIFTTKEYPPDDLAEFQKEKSEGAGLGAGAREILASIREMPRTMRQLAWVQICTWMGLFCMWLYFPVAVARNVFAAADTNSPLYSTGVEWAGICFGMYSLVCFGFSFVLPMLARQLRSQGDPQPLLDVRRPGADFRGRDSQQVSAVAFHDRSRHRLGQHALHAVFHSCRIVAPRKNWSLHGDFQLLHRDSRNHGIAWIRLGDGASAEQQPHCRSGGGRNLLHAGGDIDAARAGFVRLAAGERFVTGKRSRGEVNVKKSREEDRSFRSTTPSSGLTARAPRPVPIPRARRGRSLLAPGLRKA
jgi:maltose/moltooligosaccharide transporter